MKLHSLHVQNFRMLEDFKVNKLGRLNLIVGKNNSGKSSVLEALRIYAGNANRFLLKNIAESHNEKFSINYKESNEEDGLPFESFFTGRCFPDNEEKAIVIGEFNDSTTAIKLQHIFLNKTEQIVTTEKGETNSRVSLQPVSKSKISEITNDDNLLQAVLVSKGNKTSLIVLNDERYFSRRTFDAVFENQENYPCSYISTQFFSLNELAEDWDKVALTDYESQIKTALRFIESDFENIAFVANESRNNSSSTSSSIKRFAKVKLANMKKPVPLNSMGDGMLRVLQLALKIFSARGGFLLIDEFENGLHFSVQEKIWDWLFCLSQDLDIQVFATTHSWDCVESFNKVARKYKDIEGVLFRMGQSVKASDRGKVIATEFNEEQLANLTQADVEVR